LFGGSEGKLKLKTMSVQLKIKVTKEVLFKSRMCQTELGMNCAISLAVRDILPNAIVGRYYIAPFYYTGYKNGENWEPDRTCMIPLPIEASSFTQDFDYSAPAQRVLLPELEFEITIPDEVIEKINIDELRPLLQNHPTLELI
jgi:hypothetical protein